jgi:hypothetical protein
LEVIVDLPTRSLLRFVSAPTDLRPLSELPALLLMPPGREVRGREVIGYSGRTLGRMVDLLVDRDRLAADFLIWSRSAVQAGGRAVVPCAGCGRMRGGSQREAA